MPSTPPPLPHPTTRLTPWCIASAEKQFDEPNRINWSAIFFSAFVSLALVVGVIAWIITHPQKAASSLASTSVAAVEPALEPPPPQTPVVWATPVCDRPHSRDEIARNIPLMEEDPPPLLPPSLLQPQPAPQAAAVKQAPAGETYGTQVLFHSKQAVAADLAQHDHKLLFVMHISGNFEDSCFT